jgi:GTPase SAR1 family protein
MKNEIGDDAAISFSIGFYQGIGANRSIETSFDVGCSLIQLKGIPEHLTPVLLKKEISTSKKNTSMDTAEIDKPSYLLAPSLRNTRSQGEILVADPNISVKNEFLEEIRYVEFIKQTKNSIKLDEIFVFPNISKTKDAFEKEVLNEEYFLQGKDTAIVIKGDDSSGKTALLRWLFIQLSTESYPLYIDAETIVKTKNFDPIIQDLFLEQYSGSFTDWVNKKDKIALVDNFHHNISSNFLNYLAGNFSIVIICVDSSEWVAYFKDDPSFAKYTTLSLSQFSLAKQEELIKLWKKMDFPNQTELDYLEIDKLEAKVNSVITKNRIVPRYPFHILSILQTFESFMPKDYAITAYGHCYQALVTAQLLKKGIKNEFIDDCFNFLRELSFDIYNKRRNDENYEISHYHDFKD